ncbi:MAG: pseudouridine synthase [Negativicutes bacterium]|jgi:23S rRNA pseudouridine2605 synthase
MAKERIQKLIALAGIASRRAAEEIILAGKVRVNNKTVCELGVKADLEFDKVEVDGKLLEAQAKVYVLLHKPKGVITSCDDEGGRETVLDYLKDISERVFPVGRLDYNTEGVLLLTNDGELANRLIHPKYKVDKTYVARLDGIPSEEQLQTLRTGVMIEGKRTLEAKVQLLEVDIARKIAEVEIIIREGRNRQVRLMIESIGCRVRSLARTQFGCLNLKGIRRGQCRKLKEIEIQQLLESAGMVYQKRDFSEPQEPGQTRTPRKPVAKAFESFAKKRIKR